MTQRANIVDEMNPLKAQPCYFVIIYSVSLIVFSRYILNVTQVSICPVQEIVGVINGDGIGPCYLGRDNHRHIGSIHASSCNECSRTPVCPVDMPVGANTEGSGPEAKRDSCSPSTEMKFPCLSERKKSWQKVSTTAMMVNR